MRTRIFVVSRFIPLFAAAGFLAAALRAAPPDAGPARVGEGYTAVIDGKDVPAPDIRMGDAETVARIIDEGKNRSQVMAHLEHLTKHIGPRLTGSSNAEAANRWCVEKYEEWGLANAHIEEWGTIPVRFDRGPSTGKVFSIREREGDDGATVRQRGTAREMQFTTYAWGAGTNGPVAGHVVRMPATEEEYDAVRDDLAGAWVLLKADPGGGMRRGGAASARYRAAGEARKKVAGGTPVEELAWDDRLIFEGINGFISTSRDERVWTSSSPGWRSLDADTLPVDVFVTVRLSDYDYINSRVSDGEMIEVEFDLPHTFTAGPIPCYNTIAEIRGTEFPDEVVIVSAHLDSWNGPGSEGCTDNGTGSAVTLEAARILAAVGAKPRRTIRFVHWTGEEQGLLGSRAYVQKHEGELEKVSAVFVDDGGTNYQGGLQAIEVMVPMLAAATAPVNSAFPEMKVNVQTRPRMPRGGASDHASFNAKGVPGFFWDEVGRAEYGFGWHTQNDTLEIAIPEYLVQSATCSAITAYNLACADTLLPREPREEPKPEEPKPEEPKPETPQT